ASLKTHRLSRIFETLISVSGPNQDFCRDLVNGGFRDDSAAWRAGPMPRPHCRDVCFLLPECRMKIGFLPLFASIAPAVLWPQSAYRPDIPKTWDEAALEEWVTPVAGLNVRPTHISAKEYYSLVVYNLRSYPVYMPGREPEGYWEMLRRTGPQPLIQPETLKTEGEWIDAGRRVFDEASTPQLTTFDAQLTSQVRSREFLEQKHVRPLPDGTLDSLRWVPTRQGVGLSIPFCSGCHVLRKSDGTRIPGASARAEGSRTRSFQPGTLRATDLESTHHVLRGGAPFFMGGGSLGTWLYQAYGVPWLKDDPHERLKHVTESEYGALVDADRMGGAIARWNGSLLYPAKIPDLIGIKDRKYLDHTATHLHRGIGDLMRYAAQVSFAELADFGPYHMLAPDTKRVRERLPDEA